MYRLIITFIILLFCLLIFTAIATASPVDTSLISSLEYNINTDKIISFLEKMIAPTGILGLWVRYEMNKSKVKREEKQKHNELLLKIESSDKRQDESIKEISLRLTKLEEHTEAENASKTIRIKIDEIVVNSTSEIKHKGIEALIAYSAGKFSGIFSYILLNDFTTSIDSLQVYIEVVFNQIRNFEVKDIDEKDKDRFIKAVMPKLNTITSKFIIDNITTFSKKNGVRRHEFIDNSCTYMRDLILKNIEVYNENYKGIDKPL